jgi:hypothetical protein
VRGQISAAQGRPLFHRSHFLSRTSAGKLPIYFWLAATAIMLVVCTENLNPNVLMMKSAQDSVRTYDAGSLVQAEKPAHLYAKIDAF